MAENRSRTSEGRHRARRAALASVIGAVAIAFVAVLPAGAQPDGSAAAPTYQRKGTYAGQGKDHHRDWRRPMQQYSSQTSAGSFQRPYPYHLDYYRAKWGGSYAPYFGNLYGPPNYFFNGTPFFGGFGPYSGYNGFNGFNGFQGGGFNGGFGGFGNPGFEGGGAPYGPFIDGAAPPFEGEVAP